MMKRIITWLYNRYCRVQLETLYINGLQRKFNVELNPHDLKVRNDGCMDFVGSGACDSVFTEILGEYSDAFFGLGESEEARTHLQRAINVVVKVEDKINEYAMPVEDEEEIDINDPL